MSRRILAAICLTAVVAGVAAPCASAALISPLSMTVKVGPSPSEPGKFRYEFELKLTNGTGTWLPTQGFGGIVFGDVQSAASPLADFVADAASLPAGPWTAVGGSSGFHNGPTLVPIINSSTADPVIWTPAALGAKLTWAGASATNTCDLSFSTLYTSNLGDPAEFQPALCTFIPEPGGALLALVAFPSLAAVWRRRAAAALVTI